MKSILSILTAVVLLISSFTFSSCKGCGKKEGDSAGGDSETTNNSDTNTDNPALLNTDDSVPNTDLTPQEQESDTNTDNPALLNTDDSVPNTDLTPQEQELDVLLEKALTKIRDMAKRAEAVKKRVETEKAKPEKPEAETKIAHNTVAGFLNELSLDDAVEVANDVRSKMVSVERVSLKAKAKEVAKATMEVAAAAGEVNKLLQAMTGMQPFQRATDAKDEAEAWATATEWAVLGEDMKNAGLFASNAAQAAANAAKYAGAVAEGVRGTVAIVVKEARNAATRAAKLI